MATLIVKSENPNLSYILGKNPSSPALVKGIRKGVAVGWYANPSTYCINFKDSKAEVSFKEYEEQEYEYLTITSYNAAFAYYSLLNTFFRLNSVDEKDCDGHKTEITFGCLNIKRKDKVEDDGIKSHYDTMFMSYFKDVQYDVTELSKNNFRVTLSSDKSVNYLLSVAYIYLFIIAVKNGENMFMEEGLKGSLIELMKRIRAPYFVRYIFKSNFMVEGNKEQLIELAKDYDGVLKLEPGNLMLNRLRFVRDNEWYGTRDIVDLGCGEGRFTFALASNKKIDGKFDVHAIDIDEKRIEYVKRKASNKKMDNIYTYPSFDEFIETNGQDVDLLCTEVLEHMEIDEAKKLLRKILSLSNVKNVLITMPNKEFNKFYDIGDDDSRHDDHKFEPTESEFNAFILECAIGKAVKFYQIGDYVDGFRPTLAALIS